ncbi:synaptic vesicle 2-related protein [Helicoverpa armigera]|uniref:synaptic vesicle 2-related protein n=1 Tax=Helicoverpa armigera TaxID=29058 RepID=UPI003082D92D
MAEKNNNMVSEKVPFETALDRAGFGLYSYIMTSLAGFAIISFACVVYASTIIVPSSACELETTTSQQGLLAAGPVVGSTLGGIMWGYLADTRGRRKMILVGLLGGITFNLIAAISVNWVMLMIFQFIASLFASGMYSMSMSLLSESVPMAKRNLVVLLVSSIFMLSQGLMAALAIPIIPLRFSHYLPALDIYWNSWRTLLVVYSVPSIVTFIWMLFMKESPKFVYVKGDEDRAIEILKTIHRVNNLRSKEELAVSGLIQEVSATSGPSSTKDQIVPLFKTPLLKYTLIMITLFTFQQVGAFLVWLPTIADQFVRILQSGEDSDLTMCGIIAMEAPVDLDAVPCALNETSLLMVLGVGAVHSLINIVLSMAIGKTGRRNMVLVVTTLCGVSGILVNLVPNAIGSAVLFVVLSTGIVVIGFYTAIIVALFPTHLRALAIALPMTFGRIGTFASIQILNLMFANSCDAGFYLFASLFASSAIIASFLPDDRRLQRAAPAPEIKEENIEETNEN